MDLITISKQVHSFNSKLSNPMTESEIDSTILQPWQSAFNVTSEKTQQRNSHE